MGVLTRSQRLKLQQEQEQEQEQPSCSLTLTSKTVDQSDVNANVRIRTCLATTITVKHEEQSRHRGPFTDTTSRYFKKRKINVKEENLDGPTSSSSSTFCDDEVTPTNHSRLNLWLHNVKSANSKMMEERTVKTEDNLLSSSPRSVILRGGAMSSSTTAFVSPSPSRSIRRRNLKPKTLSYQQQTMKDDDTTISSPSKRDSSKPSTPKRRSPTKKKNQSTGTTPVKPTQSFGALYYNSPQFLKWCQEKSADISQEELTSLPKDVPVHTLILGTHPSIKSLEKNEYFGHSQNVFWWIAGDCLGFRRQKGVSESSGKPFQLCEHLRYDETHIISYPQQVACLLSKGIALWDIVQSCSRQGSLDQDIKNAIGNDIETFVSLKFPTVKRIVLANGGTGCQNFKQHNRDWLDRDINDAVTQAATPKVILVPGANIESRREFGKVLSNRRDKYFDSHGNLRSDASLRNGHRIVECISALAVSPAAARYSYLEKRIHWETYVYQPALKDYQNWIDSSALAANNNNDDSKQS